MANPDLISGFDTNDINTEAVPASLQSDGYSALQVVESKHYNEMFKQLFAAANKNRNDGVWEWEAPSLNDTEYNEGSITRYLGKVYISLIDNNEVEPINDGTNWVCIDETLLNAVQKTGNETIAGVKTFSSSPIVPTPTTGTQAVNKDYVDSKPFLPIGTILNGYTIFDNCIVAFGGVFNRADYPKLWAYLQANPSLVKTEAEWQTENIANGNCGFFSSGNGTTTFRVPNLDKAFLRPDSRSIASYQGDAIRNITGTYTSRMLRNDSSGYQYASGAFNQSTSSSGAGTGINSGGTYAPLTFDASRVVPTTTENRPKNIAVLPLIVAK